MTPRCATQSICLNQTSCSSRPHGRTIRGQRTVQIAIARSSTNTILLPYCASNTPIILCWSGLPLNESPTAKSQIGSPRRCIIFGLGGLPKRCSLLLPYLSLSLPTFPPHHNYLSPPSRLDRANIQHLGMEKIKSPSPSTILDSPDIPAGKPASPQKAKQTSQKPKQTKSRNGTISLLLPSTTLS
jgi:hypothetical protein